MTPQLPKGTRDFPPPEMMVRNKLVDTIKKLFERYGYAPLDTPIFERFDVLSSKYAGGAEILKETFTFTDQGKRELGLRYDLTVPLARYIAMNPTIKMPFKRYQIGPVFRDGPIAAGRYRQFTQCDADCVGSPKLATDAELLALAAAVFSELNLTARIAVNNRKLLNDVLAAAGVEETEHDGVLLSLDKLEKFGADAVSKELAQKKVPKKVIDTIFEFITQAGDTDEKVRALKIKLPHSAGLAEIEELFGNLKNLQIPFDFDITLARGLSYYTGTIFEVVLKNSTITSSVAGGGRYDAMIGNLIGKIQFPAVGISFGIDRIYDALLETNRDVQKTPTQVFVIPLGTLKECLQLTQQLRNAGINADVDVLGRNPSKNLSYANAFGIPFAVIVGSDELAAGKFKLKNMETGTEELLNFAEIVGRIMPAV